MNMNYLKDTAQNIFILYIYIYTYTNFNTLI